MGWEYETFINQPAWVIMGVMELMQSEHKELKKNAKRKP